ncbi:hypothetical protein JCM10908_002789 [Rhodotorula pacifica]|uniref:uncharacterized protein n=1 Tax=Rhodotorula pacifica TaxID=1495444 RepID=UPI0031811C4E
MSTSSTTDATSPPVRSTKLAQTRAGLAYLANPTKNPAPGSLVTRSSLKTFRYVLKFVFWRLVRYAKYAIIGAGSAALAGTVLGTALPWLGALIVPSVPVAAAMGATTALIKFTWRHTGNRFMSGWHAAGEGRDARADEAGDAKDASEELSRSARRAARAERSWQTEATFA